MPLTVRWISCASLLVALLAAVAIAADRPVLRRTAPAPKPPAAPAVPLVTIVKTDGTTVRGQITASDPDSVTVTPAAKPNVAEAPEPVAVPWKDVKSVSNGFNQSKAHAQWKRDRHAELCDTCHGDRTTLCSTCKGTTHDPASGKDCPKCRGELLVECKTPRCEEGQIPCTNHCLQLTEGRWETREDGKKWRSFPVGRGYHSFSEGHLGNVIQIDRKEGTARDVGPCPVCHAKTKIICPACRGMSRTPCATCAARKDAAPCPAGCDAGRTPCVPCAGSGLKKA
jgi:hypothetical protein